MKALMVSRIVLAVVLVAALVPNAAHGIDSRGGEKSGNFVEPKPGQLPGHQLGGWYLGVYGRYTTTGLYLTQVYPRTAAANVGLEVGDRIVAVNGRSISPRFPLDVALQTTRNGWVRLLVQDGRTGRLINVDVRLTLGRVHT